MSLLSDYRQTLDYLYSQLPMFQRMGGPAMKKDLTNIRRLCAILDHPERRFPSIHIAGTNGKGSTAHLLAAILQAKGLKTGLYTSPHYRDFRERIKINGQLMERQGVVDFVKAVRTYISEVQPSFFEITVAMAFDYFASEQVDVAVIETGLGGRLDSTNILHPLLSVITNISYDHMEFLGDTLDKIAFEKAGIIKEKTPVVIGQRHPETAPVFRRVADERSAPLCWAADVVQVKTQQATFAESRVGVYRKGELWLDTLKLDMSSPFLEENLATVLATVENLNTVHSFGLDEEVIRQGLQQVKQSTYFIGRWEKLGDHPLTLGDSAHNEAGLKHVFEKIREIPHRQLHIVLGVTREKDLEKLFALLPAEAQYYFAKADIPRGLEAKKLEQEARMAGFTGRSYVSVKNALKAARRRAQPEDIIFVGGSIFTLAEVL